jgi:hypothetical protein
LGPVCSAIGVARGLLGSSEHGLEVADGALASGGGIDRLCIKIRGRRSEAIVCDNQLVDTDTSEPATAIFGGDMMVHK